MCSQSISGSSLLSGYNEDDVRERSGRSRREFEEIDAVLYDEEKSKRAAIKKICEEWSSKPHFRVRGRLCQIEREEALRLIPASISRSTDLNPNGSIASSTFDLLSSQPKDSGFGSNEINTLLNDNGSGRSSIDSIEGSEITNNSDLDEDDDGENRTNTPLNEHFSDASADSFDTDEDDDDEADEHDEDDFSSAISDRHRSKHHHHRHHHSSHWKQPQMLIKCMKDSVVNSLASFLLRQFFTEQQMNLQRYTKLICERNAIKLRPKLRPYSLPPRSLSQNRFSLPSGSPMTANGALVQLTQLPFRATPEPDMQLTGLLRVTPIRISNLGAISNAPTSPRKLQMPVPPPPPPPPAPASISTLPLSNPFERAPTASLAEKRNPQQISLIGTAVTNLPSHLALIPSQPSTASTQNPIRQSSSAWRYRSATATTTNTTVQTHEPNTRLPPINIERISSNDQIPLNRTNTIVEAIPPATRAVSGTSNGSSLSNTGKVRTLASLSKLQKNPRPITISSMNPTKDLSHPSSISPTRSIGNTLTPSSAARSTPATRNSSQQQQQQQKRPVVTTKAPPPPPPSTVIKIPAPHIY